MKLKTKLTLMFTLILVIIAAAALFFMNYLDNLSQEKTSQSTLEKAAELLWDGVMIEDDNVWYYGSDTLPEYDDGLWYVLYDAEGTVISGTDVTEGKADESARLGYYVVRSDSGHVYYCYDFLLWEELRGRGDSSGEPSGELKLSDSASGELSASGGKSTDTAGNAGTSEEITDRTLSDDAEQDASAEISASGEPSAEFSINARFFTYEPKSDKDAPASYRMRIIMPGGQTTRMYRVALIVLPILVLLAAVGGWLLAGRALKPIKKITASAREISGGEDLTRRIDIGKGRDEVHELADTFNDMLERLDKSFRTERQFTSDASHELRTPTAVILAECETALKTAQTPEEYAESVESIQRQGRKMASLVGKLLTFTRRELGTEKAVLEETDLTELTQAVCEEQEMIAPKNISVKSDLQPNVTAKADMDLIMSLIQNLISNACKYGKENGHVWVTLRRAEGKVILTVKDDGIGIATEQQEHVFDRFYQADPSRSNRDGSMGLGLAMAQQIAHMHGGSISLKSEPGKGSTFTLTMPDGEKT